MSDSKGNNKDLLGDLEKIQNILNQSPSNGSSKDAPLNDEDCNALPLNQDKNQPDIPTLSDIVSEEPNSESDSTSGQTTPEAEPHSADQDKHNNPFIPYEAIDRFNKERSSMRNFAAEVMQAAQQGMENSQVDSFDLFKYSKTHHVASTSNNSNKANLDTPGLASQENKFPPKNMIKLPSDTEISEIVDDIIDEYRPVLEEALKESLTEFIKNSLQDNSKK